ncbi:hypothetical protein X946_5462 [Burkholderia sp. ABCPW 111]|nr:hypothetical protein X946_5462 [Burkholderia sp. ABCPW 111]
MRRRAKRDAARGRRRTSAHPHIRANAQIRICAFANRQGRSVAPRAVDSQPCDAGIRAAPHAVRHARRTAISDGTHARCAGNAMLRRASRGRPQRHGFAIDTGTTRSEPAPSSSAIAIDRGDAPNQALPALHSGNLPSQPTRAFDGRAKRTSQTKPPKRRTRTGGPHERAIQYFASRGNRLRRTLLNSRARPPANRQGCTDVPQRHRPRNPVPA